MTGNRLHLTPKAWVECSVPECGESVQQPFISICAILGVGGVLIEGCVNDREEKFSVIGTQLELL